MARLNAQNRQDCWNINGEECKTNSKNCYNKEKIMVNLPIKYKKNH